MTITTSRPLAAIEADIAALSAEANDRATALTAAEQNLARLRDDIANGRGSHAPADLAAAEHEVEFHRLGLEATRGPAFDLAEERRSCQVENLIAQAAEIITERNAAIDAAVTDLQAALDRVVEERGRLADATFSLRMEAQNVNAPNERRINIGIGRQFIGGTFLGSRDLFPQVQEMTNRALAVLNRSI